MNNDPSRARGAVQDSRSGNIMLFQAPVFGGHAIAMAIVAGVAAAMTGLPPRSLLVPYVALLVPGLALGPVLYWARLARDRPKSFAFRIGIAAFFYAQAFMLALGFSAVWLHILSYGEAADIFGLSSWLLPALVSILAYVLVPRMLKEMQRARSGSAPQM